VASENEKGGYKIVTDSQATWGMLQDLN